MHISELTRHMYQLHTQWYHDQDNKSGGEYICI
jgi:hypothetical protein